MLVQLVIIILAVVAYLNLNNAPLTEDHRKRKLINFVSVLLILQSGLRSVMVGRDTYAYYLQFQEVSQMDWKAIFDNFHAVYVEGEGKDAGYPLIVKIFQIFSNNYTLYLLGIAALFFLSLREVGIRYLQKSSDILIALLLYQSIFYGFFTITGLRQTIATSFTLFAVKYIERKKIIPFLFLIFVGAFIHKSALLFIPFYFIGRLKISRGIMLGSLMAFPFLIIFSRAFATFMASLTQNEQYMGYALSTSNTSGAQNFALMILGCSVWTMILWKKIKAIDPMVVNACALGLAFTPLTWVDPALMRVVQYFSIFLLFLLPSLINLTDSKLRSPIYYSLVIFFIFIILRGNNYYVFFWEEVSQEFLYNYGF